MRFLFRLTSVACLAVSLCMWLLSFPAQCDTLGDIELAARSTRVLETNFSQRKDIPFLDIPLLSSGKLCFDIAEKGSEYVFWEYRNPERAGFSYSAGKIAFWTADGGKSSDPTQEKFLKVMVREMLGWIAFDRKELERNYSLESRSIGTVTLVPKKPNPLFSVAELHFSRDLAFVESIRFTGPQGDSTTITFTGGRAGAGLSPDCRP